MAGTFFGHDPKLPAFRGEKSCAYDDEYSYVPEDEIDLINDETFGDTADLTTDWEEHHTKFAEEAESRQNGDKTVDSGFHTIEKKYRTQEEYMEHSISQLVVDDDDMDDPAVLNVSRSKPIPKRKQNLDDIFIGASSPPFIDPEQLMSPTSKNIWGSPARETVQKPVDPLQSLFSRARSRALNESFGNNRPQSPLDQAQSLPKVFTARELEREMFDSPKVFTAEDLEKQLRGEIHRKPPSPHYPQPARMPQYPVRMPGPPPSQSPQDVPHPMTFRGPPLGYTPVTPVYADGRNSPLMFQSAQADRTSPLLHENRQSPLTIGMALTSAIARLAASPSPPPTIPVPLSRTPTPDFTRMISPSVNDAMLYGSDITPNRMVSNPVGIPRQVGQNRQYVGSYDSPGAGQRIPMVYPHSDPGRHNMNQSNRRSLENQQQLSAQRTPGPRMSSRGGLRQTVGPYREPLAYREKRHYHFHNANNHHSKPADIYSGLMTQKEKDWIIKIQLMQLQTDNPYLDDYYYTTYSMKKKALERQKNSETEEQEDPKLVIPNFSKLDSKLYKPAQFEGSLGKLSTSSVHNPRQIIDLSRVAAGAEDMESQGMSKELHRFRQLLMDIEKAYNLLLESEEIEKKVLALTEDSRQPLLEQRRYNVYHLYAFFHCAAGTPDIFLLLMTVRKARKLLGRVIPILAKEESETLVLKIFKNLNQLTQSIKKDNAEEGLLTLFKPVQRVIENCDLEYLVKIADCLQHIDDQSSSKVSNTLLQNKFGCSVILSMLTRGETIYQTVSPVDLDNQHQTEWCQFVEEFAEALSSLPEESPLTAVLPSSTKLSKHLDRLLNKKLVASLEDRIQMLTPIQVPAS